MKLKHFFLALVVLSFSCPSIGQPILQLDFDGTTATCNPIQGNQPTAGTLAAHLNINSPDALIKGSTIACAPAGTQNANTYCITSGWSATQNDYLELAMWADAGYYLNISSISFYVSRAGSNPPQNFAIAHDGTGVFATQTGATLSPIMTLFNWTSFTPFSTTIGGTARFRFYAWGANTNSSTGLLRIDEIRVYGTLTTSPTSGLWFSSGANINNTNSGNVGIGNTTPLAKLDVNGNIFTNGKLIIGSDYTSDLSLIGSQYAMSVDGAAIFTKIKIKSHASWPDYVFDSIYYLRSLPQVEAYIKKYKHLPDLPNADSIRKDGFDLSENQAALFRKVEELTLYIIELNKKVEALINENKQLKKQIENKEE